VELDKSGKPPMFSGKTGTCLISSCTTDRRTTDGLEVRVGVLGSPKRPGTLSKRECLQSTMTPVIRENTVARKVNPGLHLCTASQKHTPETPDLGSEGMIEEVRSGCCSDAFESSRTADWARNPSSMEIGEHRKDGLDLEAGEQEAIAAMAARTVVRPADHIVVTKRWTGVERLRTRSSQSWPPDTQRGYMAGALVWHC
jgi:hypothetical protein